MEPSSRQLRIRFPGLGRMKTSEELQEGWGGWCSVGLEQRCCKCSPCLRQVCSEPSATPLCPVLSHLIPSRSEESRELSRVSILFSCQESRIVSARNKLEEKIKTVRQVSDGVGSYSYPGSHSLMWAFPEMCLK